MNRKYILQLLAACGLTVAFFVMLGYAGDMDFCDQVILRMSYEEYDSVKARLKEMTGHEPSDREIAHWWDEHHKGTRR